MAHQARFPGSRSFVFVLLIMQACAGKKTEEPLHWYNSAGIHAEIKNGLLLSNGKPFSGMIFTLQANQKDTAEIVGFKEGREHGTWKKFYPGNRLMELRHFENGRKTGGLTAWWPNNALKLQYHFKDGEYSGTCREWAANGVLISEMNYVNGHEAGRQMQFYDDGKVKANYIITGGRRYGLLGTKNCVNVTDSIFKK